MRLWISWMRKEERYAMLLGCQFKIGAWSVIEWNLYSNKLSHRTITSLYISSLDINLSYSSPFSFFNIFNYLILMSICIIITLSIISSNISNKGLLSGFIFITGYAPGHSLLIKLLSNDLHKNSLVLANRY